MSCCLKKNIRLVQLKSFKDKNTLQKDLLRKTLKQKKQEQIPAFTKTYVLIRI